MEPGGTQEGQRAKEDREPTALVSEVQSQHDRCWVCYGKGNNHAHDHRQCKVYEADKKAYFAAHPEMKPKPIGRRRAEMGEKAKAKAKGKAEEEVMVVDLAKTDE